MLGIMSVERKVQIRKDSYQHIWIVLHRFILLKPTFQFSWLQNEGQLFYKSHISQNKYLLCDKHKVKIILMGYFWSVLIRPDKVQVNVQKWSETVWIKMSVWN